MDKEDQCMACGEQCHGEPAVLLNGGLGPFCGDCYAEICGEVLEEAHSELVANCITMQNTLVGAYKAIDQALMRVMEAS